ncbi:MAG TPA: phosphoribosyltransferase [Holophagaceae bacterium]|nr:phosphoribosyltransferase [Holophagaceae bacterium]
MIGLYRDRAEAGQILAHALEAFRDWKHALVLGLPRGGVPVAFEVAEALHLPLDVFVVRKLGLPGQEELAMGALAQGDVVVYNPEVLDMARPGEAAVARVLERERKELRRRVEAYRGDRPPLEVKGRTLILVDDGLATGATMRAAVQALQSQGPASIVVAVPVAPPDTCAELAREVDLLVCPRRPEAFSAIGQWYETFGQTTDEEVRDCLEHARIP